MSHTNLTPKTNHMQKRKSKESFVYEIKTYFHLKHFISSIFTVIGYRLTHVGLGFWLTG